MQTSHVRRRARLAGAVVALATLLPAAQAGAHALVSPAVALTGKLQQFTLSVPTEKENATTTKIQLDVPAGFSIDSFEPAPGWKRSVASRGSGEGAVVQRITWSGGHVPTEEDSVFRFNASVSKAKTYTFHVVQTYSDGSVADWSGPESSDTPAPTMQAVESFGGGGGGGGSTTVSILALVVAAIALILAGVGLAGGRGGGRPLA